MSDSILGITIPGTPAGDPDVLRTAARGWQQAADELRGGIATARSGLDQLDWTGAGGTAFQASQTTLTQHGQDAAQHFEDFAKGLLDAAGKIEFAQNAYKDALAVAVGATAVGLLGSIFTLGLSDVAAAAVVAGSAETMGGVLVTLDLSMIGITEGIEITVQALLRVLFAVIGQFTTNLVAQETSSVLTTGDLTGNLNFGEAAIFSAGAIVPGMTSLTGLKGFAAAAATGAGLDAAGELVGKGSINLDTLLISAGAAGLFHASGEAYLSLANRRATRLALPPQREAVPPALTQTVLPTRATLLSQYAGEADPNNPARFFGQNSLVQYMSPAEREAHRLFIDSQGLLRKTDGTLFDTSSASSGWSGGQYAIFVMDGKGNLYAESNPVVGLIHHSSLVAGAPVAGAGEIGVSAGKLMVMTDKSGHYFPTKAMNNVVVKWLSLQGLDTSALKQYDWNNIPR